MVLIYIILTVLVQPVFSQAQNPDLQRGIAEFRQENFEEALDSLLKALAAEPASSLPSYYLGKTYKNLQNYIEAKKYFRNALSLSPVIKEAYIELAEVHYQLGEHQDGLDILAKAERENIRPGQTAYVKGLVLLALNKNLEAVESFRTAREMNPELLQAAEYQIGVAFLKEGQLEEAEWRFSNVINEDPDTDMGLFARSYLEKIPRKKSAQTPLRYYLGVHFQYDDNVVLRPEDESAAADISDDDDYREVIAAGIEFFPETTGPVGIDGHYSMNYSNHHDLESRDYHSHSFVLVPYYQIDVSSKVALGVNYSYSWLDDNTYLATGSVSPIYTRVFAKNHTFQTYLGYERKEFFWHTENADEDRDADEYSVTFNWYYFFAQDREALIPFMEKFDLSSFGQNKGYFNLLYRVVRNDTEGENWDAVGSTWMATTLFDVHEKIKLSISGNTVYWNFANRHTFFDVERRDLGYGFSALFFYRFFRNANIQFLYAYNRNDSNIALYDYDRNIYSVGIEWRY